jgi:putative transposase
MRPCPLVDPGICRDNGSRHVAGDLAKWLGDRNIKHLRGAPYHPMTQGKIERSHQTLTNRILLENYFLPGDLEAQVAAFVDDYNYRRYRESIERAATGNGYGNVYITESACVFSIHVAIACSRH